MKVMVTLEVDVNLKAWQTEYGSETTMHALKEALADLREPGWYLNSEKWDGLATLTSVSAVVEVGHHRLAAMMDAMKN